MAQLGPLRVVVNAECPACGLLLPVDVVLTPRGVADDQVQMAVTAEPSDEVLGHLAEHQG